MAKFTAETTPKGQENINEVPAIVHRFFNTHVPNEDIYNAVRDEVADAFVLATGDSLTVAQLYAACLYFHNHYDLKKATTYEFKFNKAAIIAVLNKLGDVDNWVAFTAVDEVSLPNTTPFYPVDG